MMRQYLRVLLGQRKQRVLGDALGLERQAVGAILNGDRKVMPEHLVRLGHAWDITVSRMFGDMAIIARNLEMGWPVEQGLGGQVVSAERARAERPELPPRDRSDPR